MWVVKDLRTGLEPGHRGLVSYAGPFIRCLLPSPRSRMRAPSLARGLRGFSWGLPISRSFNLKYQYVTRWASLTRSRLQFSPARIFSAALVAVDFT
jgi:hypothetical protein